MIVAIGSILISFDPIATFFHSIPYPFIPVLDYFILILPIRENKKYFHKDGNLINYPF